MNSTNTVIRKRSQKSQVRTDQVSDLTQANFVVRDQTTEVEKMASKKNTGPKKTRDTSKMRASDVMALIALGDFEKVAEAARDYSGVSYMTLKSVVQNLQEMAVEGSERAEEILSKLSHAGISAGFGAGGAGGGGRSTPKVGEARLYRVSPKNKLNPLDLSPLGMEPGQKVKVTWEEDRIVIKAA